MHHYACHRYKKDDRTEHPHERPCGDLILHCIESEWAQFVRNWDRAAARKSTAKQKDLFTMSATRRYGTSTQAEITDRR